MIVGRSSGFCLIHLSTNLSIFINHGYTSDIKTKLNPSGFLLVKISFIINPRENISTAVVISLDIPFIFCSGAAYPLFASKSFSSVINEFSKCAIPKSAKINLSFFIKIF